jgi:SAM-dependent methyltransferase
VTRAVSALDAARWYDAFYTDDDYAWESKRVLELIGERTSDLRTLLDVGCGSGRHLEHFAAHARCVGVDIDRAALRLARRRTPPRTRLVVGDLMTLDLGRTFDAVTCLFSVIGFARTRAGLRRAVGALAAHVRPEGVVVVEPWRFSDDPVPGPTFETAVMGDEHVVRVITETRRGGQTRLDIHYASAGPRGVRTRDEQHWLGLFDREDYADAFERAGLAADLDPVGLTYRGLFVATR